MNKEDYIYYKDFPDSIFSLRQIKTIGEGTFGRVYLVEDRKKNGRFYALKMLKKSKIICFHQVSHVKDEKFILQSVDSPFIVKLYKTFQDRTYLYMLMEYVPGGELFSLLRNRIKLDKSSTVFYASEIIVAIQYLHSLNIVYRDLKPENILIAKDGHIKITDFGFAKVVVDSTWTLCGTPEYLAPEIIEGKGHNKAVDWWSLGILMYEMIAGFPPFNDPNPVLIYEKVLSGELTFTEDFDDEARDLVKRLLKVDRSRRLGNLKGGVEDIKNHPYFKGVDWKMVEERKMTPPWIPPLKSIDDTKMFDDYEEIPEYKIEKKRLSLSVDSMKESYDSIFATF